MGEYPSGMCLSSHGLILHGSDMSSLVGVGDAGNLHMTSQKFAYNQPEICIWPGGGVFDWALNEMQGNETRSFDEGTWIMPGFPPERFVGWLAFFYKLYNSPPGMQAIFGMW